MVLVFLVYVIIFYFRECQKGQRNYWTPRDMYFMLTKHPCSPSLNTVLSPITKLIMLIVYLYFVILKTFLSPEGFSLCFCTVYIKEDF